MLIKKTRCEECGKEYDIALSLCPKCHKENEHRCELKASKRMTWLPLIRQILLFLLGWAGLKFFSFIMSLSLQLYATNIYDGDKELIVKFLSDAGVNMFANSVIYLLLFVGIIIIIFPYFKNIFGEMKSLKRWFKGFSYGALLIGATIAYNVIVRSFIPSTGNKNQGTLDSMIPSFPLLSILIFGMIGPIVEEFTYRVGLFNFFQRINKYVAYILTILIFALIHFSFDNSTSEEWINELVNLPAYMLAASILCYAYERDGLVASTTAHVLNNLVSVITTIIMSLMK